MQPCSNVTMALNSQEPLTIKLHQKRKKSSRKLLADPRVSFKLRLQAHRAFLAMPVQPVLPPYPVSVVRFQRSLCALRRNEKCQAARVRFRSSTCTNPSVPALSLSQLLSPLYSKSLKLRNYVSPTKPGIRSTKICSSKFPGLAEFGGSSTWGWYAGNNQHVVKCFFQRGEGLLRIAAADKPAQTCPTTGDGSVIAHGVSTKRLSALVALPSILVSAAGLCNIIIIPLSCSSK